MSSSKLPPVSEGPIPFGNPNQPGGQQEFFGFQQQQQTPQNSTSHLFDQQQGIQQHPQQEVTSQSQAYYSSSYHEQHQQHSGADYQQQQYQHFDPSHQQYYQQYQQTYDTTQNQDPQYNYGQQQYGYSQEQSYSNGFQQQQYDYSQQQPQYAYNPQDQYHYAQQQQQQQEQPYDVNQQSYEGFQAQQPGHDTSQQVCQGAPQQNEYSNPPFANEGPEHGQLSGQLPVSENPASHFGEAGDRHEMASTIPDQITGTNAEESMHVNSDTSTTQQQQSIEHGTQQEQGLGVFEQTSQQHGEQNYGTDSVVNNQEVTQPHEQQPDTNTHVLFENQQSHNFWDQHQQPNTPFVPETSSKGDQHQLEQTNHGQQTQSSSQQQQQQQGDSSAAHMQGNNLVNNALGVQMNHRSPALNSPSLSSLSPHIGSPRLTSVVLVPCPDPNCEGENKAKAKFCGECGRSITTLSRAATPSLASFSPPNHYHQSPPPSSHSIYQRLEQNSYGGQQASQDHHHLFTQQEQSQPLEPAGPKPIDDPLQRNKGFPLATFGSGGKLCLMFSSRPGTQDVQANLSPRAVVRLQQIDDSVLSNNAQISDFIGPLFLDSSSPDMATKKQEAIDYMCRRIDGFQNLLYTLAHESTDYYQLENKLLLWKLIRHMIQDNSSGDIGKKHSVILSLLQQDRVAANSNPVDFIQTYLSHGDRSGALQYAIQEKQWAHAFIIGKFEGEPSWKNTLDQFVSNTLSTTGLYQTTLNDTGSLRVLYSIFGGSGPYAVSQLISEISVKSVEQQLSAWKETLILIMANLTEHSYEAIKSLGNLLKEHGWTDAAEICFIVYTCISTDDGFVFDELLGSQENAASGYLDPLYLSELYELASSLDRQKATILPFLQDYKLARAWLLADAGYLQVASRYLQSIMNGLTSYDKPSLYLNQGFLEKLKELCVLCRASPAVPFGIDLDLTLQDLEIKLNGLPSQSQVTASLDPSSHQHTTAEATHDTGLEPIATSDHRQKETEHSEETNKDHYRYENSEFASLDTSHIPDTAPFASENDPLHHHNQTNDFYEQLGEQHENYSQGYGYGLQQPQGKANDQHSNQKTIVDDRTKASDLSNLGENEQGNALLASEDLSFTNTLPVNEPATTTTESQPATLSAVEDISAPSYDPQGADEFTTRYDTLNFMSTYAAQDNVQDYGTSYEAQDYVSTYQAPDAHHLDYTSNSDAQEPTKDTSRYVTQNHGHDTAQGTYKDEDFTQHHTTPYDSQHSTGNGATVAQHYATSSTLETDYPTAPTVTHNHDLSSSYDTNATKATTHMNEPATLPVYPTDSIITSDEDEKSKQPIMGNSDGLGLGSYSANQNQAAIESKSTQIAPSITQESTKMGNNNTADGVDRKGWGLFSMFSRMSPAPTEKDDTNSADAILGEPNSFYYDEKEGRWVNRNASDTPTASTTLPPPPPKTSGPITAQNTPDTSLTPSSLTNMASAVPPPMSAEPPRPPLANLMNQGPPTATRAPTSGRKKPVRSRYVDVLNSPTPP